MNPWNSGEEELWDLVTPERRVIARDLLVHAHPSLVAWHLGACHYPKLLLGHGKI
jgi:hypothetical protein